MGKHRGQYCGMLVRGSGETFNLIVPVRRMKRWAKANNCEWALDESVKPPALSALNHKSWQIEDSGWNGESSDKDDNNKRLGLRFMLGNSSGVPLPPAPK